MYYCAGEPGPPLPACPHLHTTVGLLTIISFRFLNLKLNFDSIYYPLSGKADILKYLKFQSVRLMWLVLNQIWKKLKKKLQKSAKKYFFYSFLNFVQWMEWKEFWSKVTACKQKPIRACLRPSFLTYNILYY